MCDPVTIGAALATSMSLTAGTATFAVVATVGAAATGAAIGVAVGGIVNVATGRGFFEGAGRNALFGAIGGGFSGAVYNVGALAPVTSQTFATAAKPVADVAAIAIVAAVTGHILSYIQSSWAWP